MPVLHDIKYNLLRIVNSVCTPIDRLFLNEKFEEPEYPPIFLIGPPRTGTTLLYQTLVRHFKLGYVNNFVGNLYGCPNIALRVFQRFNTDVTDISFASERGSTSGLSGPHEFGNFWYRWFPREPQNADETTLTQSQKNDVRQNVRSMVDFMRQPLILKNVVNSVRIRALFDIFPDALFLVTSREPVYAAQSIYQIRQQAAPGRDDWWSVKPRNISEMASHSILEQSAAQVFYTWRQIEEDAKMTDSSRFQVIRYEDLCSEPEATLNKIGEFCRKFGVNLLNRELTLPELQISNSRKIPEPDFSQLNEYVNTLWNQTNLQLFNL